MGVDESGNANDASKRTPWYVWVGAIAAAAICVFLWMKRIDSLRKGSSGWIGVVDLVGAFLMPLVFGGMLRVAFRGITRRS